MHAIEQYPMEQRLPTGKGRRIVTILRPFFLTTTELIKDIFSCKAKSRPCHPERSKTQCGWRSRTAKQCEVSAEQDLGREQHSVPRRSRCYASPYGFDCGRRIRLPPLRMTRGRYITFRKVAKSLPCVKGGGTACRDGGIVKIRFD